MNIDERFDIISANVLFYSLYIPLNVLAIILAIPTVIIFIPITYFRNYDEFCALLTFPNILIVYYIFYKIIFDSMINLIK